MQFLQEIEMNHREKNDRVLNLGNNISIPIESTYFL